jgi:hypothetical protein
LWRLLVTFGGLIALGALGLLLAGNANAATSSGSDDTGLNGLVGSVTKTVTAATAPVTRTVDTVTEPVTKTVATVTEPVTKTVTSVTEPVAKTVAAVTRPVAPVAAVSVPVASATTFAAQAPSAPSVPAPSIAPARPALHGSSTPAQPRHVTHAAVTPRAVGSVTAQPGGVPDTPWPPAGQSFGGATGTAAASSSGASGPGNAVPAHQSTPRDGDAGWTPSTDTSSAPQRWRPYDHHHPS